LEGRIEENEPDIGTDDRAHLARNLDGLILEDPEGRLGAGELERDDWLLQD